MTLKSEIIIAHQAGLGEYFICNGLINHFSEIYDMVYLPVHKSYYFPYNESTISCLYSENPKVKLLPYDKLSSSYDSFLEGYNLPLLEVNCWNNRPRPNRFWYKYYYEQFGLSHDIRYNKCHIPTNYKKLPADCPKYRIIHDSSSEYGHYPLKLPNDKIPVIYVTPDISPNLLSWIDLFCNAYEIHTVASSVYCFVDLLLYKNKIKGKCFFHDIRNSSAPLEHEDLENIGWNVIKYPTLL